jgi:hypothetical protein
MVISLQPGTTTAGLRLAQRAPGLVRASSLQVLVEPKRLSDETGAEDDEHADLKRYHEAKRQRTQQLIEHTFGADASVHTQPSSVVVEEATSPESDLSDSNIFIRFLHPDIGLDELVQVFLPFGDIASAKLYYPQLPPGAPLRYLSAFIALMRREDALDAYQAMNRCSLRGMRIQLSWSQPVPLPSVPFAISPRSREIRGTRSPDRAVAQVGPAPGSLWTAGIAFDNADSEDEEDASSSDGDVNDEDGSDDASSSAGPDRGTLGPATTLSPERVRDLHRRLRRLDTSRPSIRNLMVHCLRHGRYAHELTAHIMMALVHPQASASQKLARLYLLHDIMCNATPDVPFGSLFRMAIEACMEEAVQHLHAFGRDVVASVGRLSGEGLRASMQHLHCVWRDSRVLPPALLAKLEPAV